jgi:hypothetical protein
MKLATNASSLVVAALVSLSGAIAACGGSSPSGQAPASPAAASATASAASSAGYSANLTFTGALSGKATSAKAPATKAHCGDGLGQVTLAVNLNGHDYDITMLTPGYKGAGKYSLGDGSTGTLLLLGDANYDGKNLFASTSGSVTYLSAKSVNIDGDLAWQIGGAGNAHISGTASCA